MRSAGPGVEYCFSGQNQKVKNTEELLKRLGVDIDAGTLRLALTHRSYAYEQGGIPTNERLEFLGDSILGFHAHMGAGSITSNIKSDRTNVVVKAGDDKMPTGLRKMGAMLGDWRRYGNDYQNSDIQARVSLYTALQ